MLELKSVQNDKHITSLGTYTLQRLQSFTFVKSRATDNHTSSKSGNISAG